MIIKNSAAFRFKKTAHTNAENGRVALDKLADKTYDAILMDVRMPKMNGLEATSVIRRMEAIREMPVIAMTAGATKEEVQECYDAGMDDYISKAFNVDELIIKLANITAGSA